MTVITVLAIRLTFTEMKFLITQSTLSSLKLKKYETVFAPE
jgi:hypothetical protein